MYADMVPNVLVGQVRGTTRPNYDEGDQRIGLLSGAEIPVAFGLPPKTELVRSGQSWSTTIPTGSAFSFVADLPTTRAELALFNAEPDTGKSYVVDAVWCM